MITKKKKQSFIYRRITSTGAAEFLAARNIEKLSRRFRQTQIVLKLHVIYIALLTPERLCERLPSRRKLPKFCQGGRYILANGCWKGGG
jgi:hypothetical protein